MIQHIAHRRSSNQRVRAKSVEGLESLECRRLLTTYNVPSGHTGVFLFPNSVAGVDVHLDSAGAPVTTTLTGSSVTIHASASNFLFVDAVPAANKHRKGVGSLLLKLSHSAGKFF